MTVHSMLARVAYGSLFVLVLPLLLIAWARRLDAILPLPAIDLPVAMQVGAWIVAGAGLALMVWAMGALLRFGGGLPMNAFPPPRFVATGPYAYVAHPIYLGCALAVAASAAALASPAGVLIVAPAAALGCAALVGGYESHALDRLFGTARPRPAWSVPVEDPSSPTLRARCGSALRILIPWLVAYEVIGHLPVPGALDAMTRMERAWPVYPSTVLVYTSGYAMAILAPMLAPTNAALHAWARTAMVGSIIGFLVMLVLPVTAAPRPFDSNAPLGWLLTLERSDGVGDRGAFPSFHAFWAVVSAATIARRSRRAAVSASIWAMVIIISCVTTGMHAIADLVAGVGLAGCALASRRIWSWSRQLAQTIGNTWIAWRIGPLRVLLHGAYAGLAAGTGVFLIGFLVGDRLAMAAGALGLASLIGAAAWGQLLVGSKRLQRPFGYFGSVIGASIACIALGSMESDHGSMWLLVAACAASAPWVQAIGRLRCLAQGCCHGAPTSAERGIVHHQPLSRVVALSGLGGAPIHPTPLYSITSNAVIGLILARLWSIGAPASSIVGIYALLAGLTRFVEESFRGEPHTPVIGGLRLYQWCSIALLVVGAIVMCIATAPVSPPVGIGPWTALVAVVMAVLHWFAMGVDFPESTRRFSRLTPS